MHVKLYHPNLNTENISWALGLCALPLPLPRQKLFNVFDCSRESRSLAVVTKTVTQLLFLAFLCLGRFLLHLFLLSCVHSFDPFTICV